jgi:hypothetical protein
MLNHRVAAVLAGSLSTLHVLCLTSVEIEIVYYVGVRGHDDKLGFPTATTRLASLRGLLPDSPQFFFEQ